MSKGKHKASLKNRKNTQQPFVKVAVFYFWYFGAGILNRVMV